MTPADQWDHLHAAGMLYCYWCDRPIEGNDALATEDGRPYHAGACVGLAAEFPHDDDAALADAIEAHGVATDDETHYAGTTGHLWAGLTERFGFDAATVYRGRDGAVEIARHESAAQAHLEMIADRLDAWSE
jgi:hypothetical protein